MQTYTHYVITEFLSRKIKDRQSEGALPRLPELAKPAALIGSVAPDAPLTLTFLLFLASDLLSQNADEPQQNGSKTQSRVGYLFGTLFFKDWRIKLAHNLFHAPLLTLLYTLVGYWGWRHGKTWGAKLFWFGASCTLHTAIDIPLHHDDGPLLLFPFDWQTRYMSPVSYWDRRHYGKQFMFFEHLLLAGLLIWWGKDWWQRRKQSRGAETPLQTQQTHR